MPRKKKAKSEAAPEESGAVSEPEHGLPSRSANPKASTVTVRNTSKRAWFTERGRVNPGNVVKWSPENAKIMVDRGLAEIVE